MAVEGYERFLPACCIVFIITGSVGGVVVTTEDASGILGNNSVSVVCGFQTQVGETIAHLSVERKGAGGSVEEIARFIPASNSTSFVTNDASLKSRARLILTTATAVLKFDRIVCTDEAVYVCMVNVLHSGWVSDEMDLRVVAFPEPPVITVSTLTSLEYHFIEVNCTSDVGRPAGSMFWFGYRSNGQIINMTSSTGPPEVPSGCTYTKSSIQGIRMTRLDNGITIRCVVSNEVDGSFLRPENPCTGACSEEGPLEVLYPVLQDDTTIILSPEKEKYPLGSSILLSCVAEGNPEPEYTWVKGYDDVIAAGRNLYIRKLEPSDFGTYRCNASNTVNHVLYHVSYQVDVVGKGSRLSGCQILITSLIVALVNKA